MNTQMVFNQEVQNSPAVDIQVMHSGKSKGASAQNCDVSKKQHTNFKQELDNCKDSNCVPAKDEPANLELVNLDPANLEVVDLDSAKANLELISLQAVISEPQDCEAEDCEVANIWNQFVLQLEKLNYGSENEVDNSMCCDSNKEELISGIVSTLEGFELLDYQSDNKRVLAKDLLAIIANVEEQIATEKSDKSVNLGMLNKLVHGPEKHADKLSEQFARMLQNSQRGTMPRQTQQDILKVVGEYLCSFESINNKQSENTNAPDETIVNVDKLESLLLNAKTVPKKGDVPGRAIGISKPEETLKTDTLVSKQVGVTGASEVVKSFGEEEIMTTVKETQTESTFMKDNVIRIVDRINTQVIEGKYDFDIELKPGFLGKLNIKLTMENGTIKVLVKTEEMAVKGMFTNQIPALQEMLKEKGVDISQFDVMYDAEPFMNNERHSFEQNDDNAQKKRNWRNNLSLDQVMGSVFYDSATDTPPLHLTNSTVEFRA